MSIWQLILNNCQKSCSVAKVTHFLPPSHTYRVQEERQTETCILSSWVSVRYIIEIKLLYVCLSRLWLSHMLCVCVCVYIFKIMFFSVVSIFFVCQCILVCHVAFWSEGMKESIFCRHGDQANYSSLSALSTVITHCQNTPLSIWACVF